MITLNEISIEQYKSYNKETILSFETLTVLIGTNASGKSNALEALRFLSWLAEGQKLSDIRYLIQQGQGVVRGEIGQLATREKDTFSLGLLLSSGAKLKVTLQYRKDDDSLHIIQEVVEIPKGNKPFYEIVRTSDSYNTDVTVSYDNFSRGKNNKHAICTDQLAIFKQILTKIESGHKKSLSIGQQNIPNIEQALQAVYFLDPAPAEMRGYANIRDKQLWPNGQNVSAILYNLWEQGEEIRKQLLGFIKSLPEQDITDIRFIETPRSEVMVQLVESFGGGEQCYDAALLSDGTLRVLTIAAMLMSAPEGSLVVIEESDNGIHPNRVQKLLKQMYEIAELRKIRVLITSHNPALLDALPIRAMSGVVFCYRSTEDGGSRLIPLPKIPDYPELIAQGSIGELMTTGTLEKFVKYHPSAGEKKQKALEWIHSFQTQLNEE